MTATPRLSSDDAKSKAKEADAILCSMDDETLYGPKCTASASAKLSNVIC
jgi:predicted helicase